MAKALNCRGVIVLNGVERDLKSLNGAERCAVASTWQSRLSEGLSRYFSAHPEEYKRLVSEGVIQ